MGLKSGSGLKKPPNFAKFKVPRLQLPSLPALPKGRRVSKRVADGHTPAGVTTQDAKRAAAGCGLLIGAGATVAVAALMVLVTVAIGIVAVIAALMWLGSSHPLPPDGAAGSHDRASQLLGHAAR